MRADSPNIPGRALTPEQKRAVIERLLAAWERAPALRLGQMITNAIGSKVADRGDIEERGKWLFFIEDEALADLLEAWR